MNKKRVRFIFIIFFTIFTIISFSVMYLFYSNRVSIQNNSQYYKLTYKETEEFVQFMESIKNRKVARELKNLNRISKVVMVLNDGIYPVEDQMLSPAVIQIRIDNQKSKENTLVLNLLIDKVKAKNFSDSQLSNQILIDSISIIYSLTHTDLPYYKKIDQINSIISNLYRDSANPFQIIRK